MKKKIFFSLVPAITVCLLFTACGSMSSFNYSDSPASDSSHMEAALAEDDWTDENYYEADLSEEGIDNAGSGSSSAAAEVMLTDDKLVYSCHLSIQTLEYADSAKSIRDTIKKYNGIIESETETNDGYDWNDPYWYDSSETSENSANRMDLYLTARIPTESYEVFVEEISSVGKLLSRSQNTDNISRAYYDTETHIKALEIEEERLLSMMESAETIEEMILVEERLTEVQNTLNSERGWLAEMDTDIAYSTVTIELREVREYTPGIQDPDPTFGERIKDSFHGAWSGFLSVMETILHGIIYLLPFIAIAIVVIIIVRIALKRRKKKQ